MSEFRTRSEVEGAYARLAARYDLMAGLLCAIGFRYGKYRRIAIETLKIRPGDTVVEIGCGTGLNFARLAEHVGPTGHIIGVDLSQPMLEVAQRRIARRRLQGVELVRSAAADYAFPQGVDGILSTCALTLEPDYDAVVARGARALRAGGRWVVADLKMASGWTRIFAPFLIRVTRPFAVSEALAKRHPWESIARYLPRSGFREYYGGFFYVAWGEKG